MKQVRLLADGVVAEIIEAPELLSGAVAVPREIFYQMLASDKVIKYVDGKVQPVTTAKKT